MYIKKIIIQGFKTYKNTTVIDMVSPHHNVVVGRNGSGKSNFFAAIRFVLSDAYTHMTREERQGLIHEGSGTVISAYVEIIFDNSDGRFPISKGEISIRRTIGLKKDDYSLDGRSATRSDIMNLLESAGFSRSNPYYIVPQGRITSLTNSKDGERLTLLKEVSGATVFENKLKESMKEMSSSNYKIQRIDETLTSIDERLSDLQIESSDLKKFQQLEKSKKIFQYNLFDREYNELNESLEDVEEKYASYLSDSQNNLKELESREQVCQELAETIKSLKISLKVSKLEKEQTDLDHDQLLTIIADKEIVLNELRSSMEGSEIKAQQIKQSIQHYSGLINEHEAKIANFKPQLLQLQAQESQFKEELTNLITKQRAIYSKQNRFSRFSSKQERDSWLNKEISLVKRKLEAKDFEINQINSEIKNYESNLGEVISKIDSLNTFLSGETNNNAISGLKNTISELRSSTNELNDQRKHLWREEIRFKSINDSLTNDLNNATNLVNQTMDRAQAQGLSAVRSISARLNLANKVYGPLAELFEVNEKYKTAAEVIAGNSLFHVVVDTDETASLIMDELIRTRSGRVTFMPLNRLQVSVVEYPDTTEHQCIPLLKKMKFDTAVGKAIRQVFGKTIVCADLQSGYELAKAFKLTAITLDGDRADTKGVISGGFRDYKKSRIDALKVQARKKKELVKTEAELKKCVEEIDDINQKLTSLNNELQLNLRDLDKLQSAQEPLKVELSQYNNKKFNLEQELKSLNSNLETLKTAKHNLLINLKEHESELNSTYTQSLTEEEVEILETLNRNIKITESNLDNVVTRLTEVETELSSYESELNSNYKPHLNKLLSDQIAIGNELEHINQFNELERELEVLSIKLDTAQARIQNVSDEFIKINNEITKSEASLQKANDQQLSILKKLEKFSKVSETTLNKKSIFSNRRDEVQKKIRDLGVLPEEAFQLSKYDKHNSDELLVQLNKVNEELTKYSHINKKAMEQYNIFTKQREELDLRREELEKSHESIENLIKNLELQKDEAIKKSFKQVARSFHDIFEKLVPLGIGHLVMQKKDGSSDDNGVNSDNSENEDDDVDMDAGATQNIENYVGVSIRVSFNSKHDEQQRIEQLSGGQKSLCAIALILAIQKCDPAPFYLFDEIDANLDTQYRTAVASMINSLSRSAQFICTTFRPEMLQVADKFYGVMFSNKVSSVSEINREEAMSFIEGQQHR